jgi:DedD protein
MERRLKERLTGAAVLVMLAVIFIPMVLDNSADSVNKITESNIPPRPDTDFRSRNASPQITPDVTEMGETQDRPPTTAQGDTSLERQSDPSDLVPEDRTPSVVDSGAEVARNTVQETADDDAAGGDAWVVQLGSFSSQSNANSLVAELQGQGYRAYIEEIKGDSGIIYRVRVGPELSRSEAEKTLAGLTEKFQLQGMILQYP